MIFDLIYADPPWLWKARSQKGEGRSAKNHYPVMSLEDIKRLPVSSIAAPRSVLAIWVLDPMLEQALEVVSAWGFERKTVGFYWVKTNKKSPIAFEASKAIVDSLLGGSKVSRGEPIPVFFTGLGYYTRANPEQLWICTRKKDPKKRVIGGGLPVRDHGVPRLLVAPVSRHSQKPEEARIRLERLFGDVRRVELFARSRRPGWDVFGNQVEGSIELGG